MTAHGVRELRVGGDSLLHVLVLGGGDGGGHCGHLAHKHELVSFTDI